MINLESCKLFGGLQPEDLKLLVEATREMRFVAGHTIFSLGEAGDGLYVVGSGVVQISVQMSNGERHIFARIPPGETFGEMALIDDQPRSASAVAEVETVVFFVPREPLQEVLRRSPALSLELMREMTQRLREFNQLHLRELLQAERLALVGRFASSIVHDLKNPLTIIGVAADLASMAEATVEARQLAQQRIRKQVERINCMVSDILEFTRGPASPLALTATDYESFVESVVQDIGLEVSIKGVTIGFVNRPPSLRLPLNPQRLSRVFLNLIFNAVDFMPDGGLISLRFDQNATEVTTEIEDTGPGIAPEVMGRLFEAFATFGKPRGTGLGLSIARRIIEEHGGRIFARNQPKGGAVFGFTLPISPGTTPTRAFKSQGGD